MFQYPYSRPIFEARLYLAFLPTKGGNWIYKKAAHKYLDIFNVIIINNHVFDKLINVTIFQTS